jgi:hypothetical protein
VMLRRVLVSVLLCLLPAVGRAQAHLPKLDTTLSAIANLKEFEEAVRYYGIHYAYEVPGNAAAKTVEFSSAQRAKLAQNGFVVTPVEAEQFFHIYESHHFGTTPRIPNFITSDCVLQLYHLFYDCTLRGIEVSELLPALETLTEGMAEGSREQADAITDSTLKAAALKNMDFFDVAEGLLRENDSTWYADDSVVTAEISKVKAHAGLEPSAIFPFQHDYSQYIPRGHYTRSDDLRRFFLAMTWYGQNGFPFYFEDHRTEEQVRQALLITDLLFRDKSDSIPLINLWDKIYRITETYVGSADDLTPYQYRKVMQSVYGKKFTAKQFADKKKLDAFYKKAPELSKPRIVSQSKEATPLKGTEFRFMGQRYLPDSYMLQKLTDYRLRRYPHGLDVMAVLDNSEAAALLDSLYPTAWPEYRPRRDALIKEFASLPEEEWFRSIYSGWIYTLKALIEERGKTYPYFMQNTAWAHKELTTALASWAEGRHDVILYGKPSMAEGGDGEPPQPRPMGYVEPVPRFWGRLHKLVGMTDSVLTQHGAMPEDMSTLFKRLSDMLAFLRTASEKELRGEELSDEEYKTIQWFGGDLEDMSLKILSLDRTVEFINEITGEKMEVERPALRGWFEVEGPDRDLACIADVHTAQDSCLEEAVGHVDEILVAVPIGGKLYLTRGGVFSYYEFNYAYSHRLTDEAWQEMIKRGRAPDRPVWISSFVAE